MGRKASTINLSEDERLYLETQMRARTIQAQTVIRARILLLKAEGISVDHIADKVGMNRKSVMLCINKYLEGGVENALFDAPGRGRNAEITDDEKPGIQAIANTTEDLLPDENHKTVSRDYEYKRLGTISLLAGIDLQTGEAIPLVKDKHSSKEYIEFLKILDSKYPETDRIRLVLDNLKVHSSEETRKYLATKPGRFEFVFTPKHGSWLNLVEGFFSKLTRQMLKGIRVKTKDELVQRIYRYFDEVNEQPVVYHWKYKLEEINSSEEVVVDTLPIQKSS